MYFHLNCFYKKCEGLSFLQNGIDVSKHFYLTALVVKRGGYKITLRVYKALKELMSITSCRGWK